MPIAILLVILWSLNWPASQIALTGLPPLSFRVFTLLGGALLLLILCLYRKEKLSVAPKSWMALITLSLLNVGFFNILSAYALHVIGGGRAAIIAFTMPLWVAIIQTLYGVKLTKERVVALLLGVIGLSLILISVIGDQEFDMFAAMLMLMAAMFWASGSVALSRTKLRISIPALAMWMTLISGAFTLLLTPLQPEPLLSMPQSVESLFGLFYGAVVGIAVCQAIWFFLLSRLEPTGASLLLLSIPPLGSLFSWLLLDAKLTVIDFVSLSFLALSALTPTVYEAILKSKQRLSFDVRNR